MSRITQFGTNSNKQIKRVYYTGSNTIYEGMALCYDYDTTTNILGYDKAAGGDVSSQTSPTTTADGYQNEGKFLRVEEPSADNAIAFAGVVAGTSWSGKTGPCWLDIYIPNGAIVPVWSDKTIVARDKLFLEAGQNTLVNDGANIGCVAIAVESRTCGTGAVVLAKLIGISDNQIRDIQQQVTAGVGPSDALWKDCPWDDIQRDPSLGIVYFEDYMGEIDVTSADGWTLDQDNSKGAIAGGATEQGGTIIFSTEAVTSTDYGLASAQLKNCMVKPAAGVTIWFEARVKINADDSAFYVGFAGVDTSLMDTSGDVDDAVDKAGFYHDSGTTANKWDCIMARTNAADAREDEITCADGTYQTLGFKINGLTSVDFYSNGVLATTATVTTTANTPNAVMCLSAAALKIADGASGAETLTMDWCKIAQLGGRA